MSTWNTEQVTNTCPHGTQKRQQHMSTWNTENNQTQNTHVVALSNAMSCALAIQFPLQLVLVLKARLSLVVKSVPVNVNCVSTYNPTCEGLDPVNSMTVTTSEPPVSA